MWVHLINGRSFWFREAQSHVTSDTQLELYAKRKVLLAEFNLKAVACWFYDNVDVMTYTAMDKLERPEPYEVQ